MLTNIVWYKKDTKAAWVQQEGEDIAIYYNVTGIERLSDNDRYPVHIRGNEGTLGIVWNVAEIKEEI